MKKWLKLDAQNRAWRTILQGAVATVILPAVYAGLRSVLDAMQSRQTLDVQEVLWVMATVALTGLTMAMEAYLHRSKVDPSALPSAQPPRPPGSSEMQAPATAVVSPLGR